MGKMHGLGLFYHKKSEEDGPEVVDEAIMRDNIIHCFHSGIKDEKHVNIFVCLFFFSIFFCPRAAGWKGDRD
jgi:hypothetical protein